MRAEVADKAADAPNPPLLDYFLVQNLYFLNNIPLQCEEQWIKNNNFKPLNNEYTKNPLKTHVLGRDWPYKCHLKVSGGERAKTFIFYLISDQNNFLPSTDRNFYFP